MKIDVVDLIIGGVSGVVSRTATAPMELAKIQRQNSYMPYTSLTDVIKQEGIAGLWKGNFSNCIRIFPQMAINFACFQMFKNAFMQNSAQKYIQNVELINFISGGLSGMIAMTAIYPLENARSRLSLQTNKDHYKGLIDVLRRTGIRQLYNGLHMSLIGFTPYNALNFMFYNKYKKSLNDIGYEGQIINLICGGLSGITAVSFTYPTDLIRRRLQLQGFDEKVPKYSGIVDCIRKIYKYEGIRGLYGGLGQCYLKIFPAIAIQFWTMETLKNI